MQEPPTGDLTIALSTIIIICIIYYHDGIFNVPNYIYSIQTMIHKNTVIYAHGHIIIIKTGEERYNISRCHVIAAEGPRGYLVFVTYTYLQEDVSFPS